ncbi:hypothetical protein GLOTRDRAFT_123633 [Gloeophyllum trabeum ATCC 11539]|uniref:S-adenosyl-L-methionine dependent methyltransferase n=1 Tax=Gloeophyllum trabeum (strain ATCC 11539 / FP-39264 / Madison 617) TaxID=670483 RepID=S7R7D0_GLOTA|nr:uncharacterized protein GLOTRDRAFT_123633 [Gloeophyllum trabeum ATCC 11539]EPQ50290.1 hypothetical protein GLOTRDRAFT_123633 [Gloeophyllum trabeum ATCC 11539]
MPGIRIATRQTLFSSPTRTRHSNHASSLRRRGELQSTLRTNNLKGDPVTHEYWLVPHSLGTWRRRLTEALLHRDFGLRVTIPGDRLCPPVPNRLNYILWLQDIVRETSDNPDGLVRGIDIGTGASAIYPLLACRLQPNWHFVATEIDQASYNHALANVLANGLADRVQVVRASPDAPLLPLGSLPDDTFDFTMCNPPFYASKEEVDASAGGKLAEPSGVCTGAAVEMITPGGESAFVRRMVDESLVLRERCRWYTSMLGKLSSVTEVVGHLKANDVPNYALTEFVQGHTRRWAVAWSLADRHLPDELARARTPALAHLLPARTALRQPFPHAPDAAALAAALASIDGAVIAHRAHEAEAEVEVEVGRDTWSRAARRKHKDRRASAGGGMRCRLGMQRDGKEGGAGMVLEARWVRGRDRALFESFVSHVGRKVGAALAARRESALAQHAGRGS